MFPKLLDGLAAMIACRLHILIVDVSVGVDVVAEVRRTGRALLGDEIVPGEGFAQERPMQFPADEETQSRVRLASRSNRTTCWRRCLPLIGRQVRGL